MTEKVLIKLLIIFGFTLGIFSKQPNIVLILTDDQDTEMDSASAMPKLLSLIGDKGATFSNSFVVSPLCCPSRSSIFTGQYVHNHGAFNNTSEGGCGSIDWQNGPEKHTFPVLMNNVGYKTFFAGKYLNSYGQDDVGGLSYVPPGWDSWMALKGNSVYYNYSLSINGTSVYHGDDPEKDYLTNVIKDEALNFIDATPNDKPFFMMLSIPSCHHPFTPEPKYANSFNTSLIPRYPNFNIKNPNKNWFVQLGEQPLKDSIIEDLDDIYRNRLRTLLTVDDMTESIINSLEDKGFFDDTYVFFTSDNGFHLGQFSMTMDKREPYESDIRVPLLVRGPGILEGIQINDVALNIDLAPTILSIVGIPLPKNMDGTSFTDLLFNERLSVDITERAFLIEHSGEGLEEYQPGCEYLGTEFKLCLYDYDCKCLDAKNNTFSCIRTLSGNKNDKYCVFPDYNFEEYYDIMKDQYEITNSIEELNTLQYDFMNQQLKYLMSCSGSNCNSITSIK